MLFVTTWIWGTKYSEEYVAKLAAGLKRHLQLPHEFYVIRPDPADPWLQVPGCFVRMRMFDPVWQKEHGIRRGDGVVCMDLDSVVTGDLNAVFVDYAECPFRILAGANSVNPCPYNGSLMMLRAGDNPQVWHDLTPESVSKLEYHEFPDDQAWLAAKLPDASRWKAGPSSGIYAFKKPGWPYTVPADQLPRGARLVVFPGYRDPSMFTHFDWVRDNWRV